MTNDVLQIRVDRKVKNDVSNILDNIGLDMSTAIRIFLNSIIKTKSMPFDINFDIYKSSVNKKISIEDLNKYMNIGEPCFNNAVDVEKYIKESRSGRKIY